jgi:hypothetical protein
LLFAFVTTLLNHIELNPVDTQASTATSAGTASSQQTAQAAS